MNSGVSFELVMPKENAEPEDGKAEVKTVFEELAVAKQNNIKSILIPEVVREKKIKFFKEPRLGCYLILDISYNSSLNKKALDSSIECLAEYKKKIAEKEEIDRLKEIEKEETLRKAEEENISQSDIEKKMASFNKVSPVVITLKNFVKTERKFYLSLDTLGQDRVFDESEQKFIVDVAKEIITTRDKLETKLLLENRDTKREMNELEARYKENVS